jgi:hypothetical protein
MDKMDILKILSQIAGSGADRGSPFLLADRLGQEELIMVQMRLANLMADVANDVGPTGIAYIEKRFPRTFQRR